MTLTLEFDEKKLISMLCTLDPDQARAFMDAMHSGSRTAGIEAVLEEVIHENLGDVVPRESRLAG